MEKPFSLAAKTKGKRIHGFLSLPNCATTKVLVTVHGLTGNAYESKSRSCLKYFRSRGWAGVRFGLYGSQDDARTLDECSMADHAADIETVVRFLRRRGFTKICIAGHSLGWPSILLSDLTGVTAIVSWDGTTVEYVRKTGFFGPYIPLIKGYVVDWGVRMVLGRKLIAERKGFPSVKELLEGKRTPMLLIVAGKSVLLKSSLEYQKFATGPSKRIVIPGATHSFTEEGAEEAMVRETFRWCSRWAKLKQL